jgi:hypothetical protein
MVSLLMYKSKYGGLIAFGSYLVSYGYSWISLSIVEHEFTSIGFVFRECTRPIELNDSFLFDSKPITGRDPSTKQWRQVHETSSNAKPYRLVNLPL